MKLATDRMARLKFWRNAILDVRPFGQLANFIIHRTGHLTADIEDGRTLTAIEKGPHARALFYSKLEGQPV